MRKDGTLTNNELRFELACLLQAVKSGTACLTDEADITWIKSELERRTREEPQSRKRNEK